MHRADAPGPQGTETGENPLVTDESSEEDGAMSTVPTPTPETARTWAILSHLSLIISAVVSAGFLAFLGPLIIWLVYKDKDALVRNAAAGSFNFALTLAIASVVATALQLTVILAPVGWLIWLAVFVLGIIFPILAALAASRYEMYRYPLTLPVLS